MDSSSSHSCTRNSSSTVVEVDSQATSSQAPYSYSMIDDSTLGKDAWKACGLILTVPSGEGFWSFS